MTKGDGIRTNAVRLVTTLVGYHPTLGMLGLGHTPLQTTTTLGMLGLGHTPLQTTTTLLGPHPGWVLLSVLLGAPRPSCSTGSACCWVPPTPAVALAQRVAGCSPPQL